MQNAARPDVSHYAYCVAWSREDAEFLATCVEFRSLSWLASSQAEALRGLRDLLHDVIADMQEQGEQVPQPFSEGALLVSRDQQVERDH